MDKENKIDINRTKAKTPFKTFLRILKYIKYEKKAFIFGLFFLILSTILMILNNMALTPIVDAITESNWTLFNTSLIKYIYLIIGLIATEYIGTITIAKMAQRLIYIIRKELFEHMQELPVEFFDRHKDGDLMSVYINDVDRLTNAIDQGISKIIISVIAFVGIIAFLFSVNFTLATINLGIVIIMIASILIIANKNTKYHMERQKDLADMNAYIDENLHGQKVIKLNRYEEASNNRFQEYVNRLKKSNFKSTAYGGTLSPLANGLSIIAISITAVLGAIFTIMQIISLGTLVTFVRLAGFLSTPVVTFAEQLNNLSIALAGAERIFAILDKKTEQDEGTVYIKEEYGKKYWVDGENKFEVMGRLEFSKVYFGYDNKIILNDISFYAKPGQKIAIIGSTGAGKTTIANLATRFYDINSGHVFVDGIDIRRIRKKDLRSIMSVVLQDVKLFDGTIKDNIQYGNLNACDKKVQKAYEIVDTGSILQKYEKGINTEINEEQENLSQGERQLISIARALVADPEILILDEATSFVDTITEKYIEKGMDVLMKDRTTVVIAHRLSTIRDADCILVLEEGEIVERGTHNELMELRGRYYLLNTGALNLT